MRAAHRAAAALVFLIATGCATGPALQPTPQAGLPVPRTAIVEGATTHEQASILLACDEARRVQAGFIPRDSVGRERELWIELRAGAGQLAERSAVLAWNTLLERASDEAALGDLVASCGVFER